MNILVQCYAPAIFSMHATLKGEREGLGTRLTTYNIFLSIHRPQEADGNDHKHEHHDDHHLEQPEHSQHPLLHSVIICQQHRNKLHLKINFCSAIHVLDRQL